MSLFSQNWPLSDDEDEGEDVTQGGTQRKRQRTMHRRPMGKRQLEAMYNRDRDAIERTVRPFGHAYEETRRRAAPRYTSQRRVYPRDRLDVHVESMLKHGHQAAIKTELARLSGADAERELHTAGYRDHLLLRLGDTDDDLTQRMFVESPVYRIMHLMGGGATPEAAVVIGSHLERMDEEEHQARDPLHDAMSYWAGVLGHRDKETRRHVLKLLRVASGQAAVPQAAATISLDTEAPLEWPTLPALNVTMLYEQHGAFAEAIDFLSRCCHDHEGDAVLWSHLSRLLLQHPQLERSSIIKPVERVHRRVLDADAACLPALYWVVRSCAPEVAAVALLKALLEMRDDEALWQMLLRLAERPWALHARGRVCRLCGFFARDVEQNPQGIQQRAMDALLAKAGDKVNNE